MPRMKGRFFETIVETRQNCAIWTRTLKLALPSTGGQCHEAAMVSRQGNRSTAVLTLKELRHSVAWCLAKSELIRHSSLATSQNAGVFAGCERSSTTPPTDGAGVASWK